MIGLKIGLEGFVSFSVFKGSRQKEKPILNLIEYHSRCGEALISIDGDYITCLAKATPPGVIPVDEIEAFRIPKGTMVVLKPGIWHSGPFLYRCNSIKILVVLPERTYANDSFVYNIPEEEQMEIEGDF
jgi:ureidoglycolate lyase